MLRTLRIPFPLFADVPDLSNVSRDIFLTIHQGFGLETGFSLGRDVISWRQSKTTRETLHDVVIARQFAPLINGISVDDDPALDTTNIVNNSEMKKEAEKRKLHRMAQVHEFLGVVAGQPKPTCYTEGILRSRKAAGSCRIHFGHGRECQSILVTLSICWSGCIQIIRKITLASSSVCKGPPWGRNSNIYSLPNQKNQSSSSRRWWGSRTWKRFGHGNWFNWIGDLDRPTDREDNWVAAGESDLEQDIGIEDPECLDLWDVSATPNVPGLIRPTRKSQRQAENVMVMVNAMETQRKKGLKKK